MMNIMPITNLGEKMKYTKTKKMQNILLASGFIFMTFAGCSDNSSEKSSTKSTPQPSNDTPQIEVVVNDNAHEIKVQEKQSDASQSKSYYLDYNIKSEYDQNAQPANEDASVRVKPRSSVDANMHVRSPYENLQVSMVVNKLSKKFIVKCSACHNDYANGVIGPSLLGKDSDYIYNKIADFKSGKTKNPLMSDLINMMSDEEIKEMANDIYTFNKEIEAMRK